MIEDCTAIILAGGDSQRMGSDKANLLLDGQTLLQRMIATMREIFPYVIVSVRQLRAEIDLPQVCDECSNAGPLAGLASGLGHITTPWAFVVACDMPFMIPAVVELLARQRGACQAVVPVVNRYPQPLAAFYARNCLAMAQQILAGGGRHSLRALLELLEVRYVDEAQLRGADRQLSSFFDLDTPQDVANAMHGVK